MRMIRRMLVRSFLSGHEEAETVTGRVSGDTLVPFYIPHDVLYFLSFSVFFALFAI